MIHKAYKLPITISMSWNSRLEAHTAELIRSSRGAMVVVMEMSLSPQANTETSISKSISRNRWLDDGRILIVIAPHIRG